MWAEQEQSSVPEPSAGCHLTCNGVPLPVAERWACHRCRKLVSPSVHSHSDLVCETNPLEPSELSGMGRRWLLLPLRTCGEAHYLRLFHVQQEMVASPRADVEDEARGTAGTELQCHLQVLLGCHCISWKRNAAGEEGDKGPPMRCIPPSPRAVGASPGCCGVPRTTDPPSAAKKTPLSSAPS